MFYLEESNHENESARLSLSLARSSNKVRVTCIFFIFIPLVGKSWQLNLIKYSVYYILLVACIDTLKNYTKNVKNHNFKSHFFMQFSCACKCVYKKTCVTCQVSHLIKERKALATQPYLPFENHVAEKRNEQIVGMKVKRPKASGSKESLHRSHISQARALSSKATNQSQV